MDEKSCWYSLKKRCKLFKWRDEIQTYRFVVHFVFNRNKILCIHIKALDSKFQLISKMSFFKFWNSLGKNVKHSLFSRAGRKVLKFYVQPQKLCNMFK